LRCRLHLPYIARETVEPCYEPSRRAALQSAQLIVGVWLDLKVLNKTIPSAPPHLFGYFSAAAVIVLDFCLAAQEVEKTANQGQMETAWRVLEEWTDPLCNVKAEGSEVGKSACESD
jgi:hypothetical protein